MICKLYSHSLAAGLGVAIALSLGQATAAKAEVTKVEIIDFGPMGNFVGREYTWIRAIMEGLVGRNDGTTGTYRVPITINYPDRSSNGFGFVDVVNNADFFQFTDQTAGEDRPVVSYTGDKIYSDFLRLQGFTYLSVQWNRTVTEILGPSYGHIDRGTDGYQIIKDATDLLRALGQHLGALVDPAPAVRWIVGHGQSASGGLLRGFLHDGHNRREGGSLFFDGFMITGANAQRCQRLIDDETPQAPPNPPVPTYMERLLDCLTLPDDGKLIHLRTQTEVERLGNRAGSNVNERVYDVAGVSHIPEFSRALRFIGANRQNPVSWQPVAKALLLHLVAWIVAGTEPPSPLRIEGQYDGAGEFHLATDADGNAIGGIRLPHMPSTLPTGLVAGSPLGIYGGEERDLTRALGYGFATSGGTFVPFSDEELARRYPTRELYVELVRRAAAALVEAGFILPEDYEAYLAGAQSIPLSHFR